MRRTSWIVALGLIASGCLLPKLDASRESLNGDASSSGGADGATSGSGGADSSGGAESAGTGARASETGGAGAGHGGDGSTSSHGSGGVTGTGSTNSGGVDAGSAGSMSSSSGGASNGGSGGAGTGGTSSGGASSTGGTTASGGHGGTTGNGGTTATGGSKATGGTIGGGGTSSGGVTGSGGASCPVCTGGAVCQSGACTCPAAKPATCSSVCVDLTSDASNCGRCGHSCKGGTCSNSECQPITLASGRTAPWALAVNASGVYWLEASSVLAVPLSGGTVVTLASSAYTTGPWDIAASASTIYWSNSGNSLNITNYNNAVMKVAATGGTAPATFAQIQNISAPRNVSVASGTVYWSDDQWLSVYQAPESTGTYKFLYDGSGPQWGPRRALALDATNAYATNTSGALFQVALSGSSAGTLVSLLGLPGSKPPVSAHINQIAAVQGFVYFTTGDWTLPSTSTQANSALYKIPIGGGTLTAITSGLAVTPALAADSSGVYFDDGNLKRLPLDGGAIQTVVTGQNAGFIELDASFVYFTDASSGVVKKVAK